MSFIQNVLNHFRGDSEPVVEYGQIFTEQAGDEYFVVNARLNKGRNDNVLQLELNRWLDNVEHPMLLELHAPTLDGLYAPFQRLLADMNSGPMRPIQTGPLGAAKLMMTAVAGKIVGAYGRIGPYPEHETAHSLELFLSWDGQRYWMLLCEGEGDSTAWTKWPTGIADAVIGLFAPGDQG